MKADQYGMSLKKFYREFNSRDVSELMALDRMKDPEYMKRIRPQIEEEVDADAQAEAIISMLKGMVK